MVNLDLWFNSTWASCHLMGWCQMKQIHVLSRIQVPWKWYPSWVGIFSPMDITFVRKLLIFLFTHLARSLACLYLNGGVALFFFWMNNNFVERKGKSHRTWKVYKIAKHPIASTIWKMYNPIQKNLIKDNLKESTLYS
jgi:hypothetical protein